MTKLVDDVLRVAFFLAVAWVVAWMTKPDLSSDTVWFVAALFAYLASDLDELKGKRKK